MSANATIYNLPPDGLAQLMGVGPVLKPTYAATLVLDASPGRVVHEIAGVNATSATCALNTGTGGVFGQLLILILADTGGVTYTLGDNFKTAAGTLNPTTGKKIVAIFVSDGTDFYEIARGTTV